MIKGYPLPVSLVGLCLLASVAQGAFFDLRDVAIEDIDETNSFTLAGKDIFATLTAGLLNPPATPNGIELNRTSSAFGVNLKGTGFGVENSANIDGDQGDEFVDVQLDQPMRIIAMHFSALGANDVGSVKIDRLPAILFSTQSPLLLLAGPLETAVTTSFRVSHEQGNGFSFDAFEVVPVPAPGAFTGGLGGLLMLGVLAHRRRGGA